jgi:hypothetical protein
MPDIIDISPTRSNAQTQIGHSATGRMLSIACSEDGQELYAGSYSNLWTSQNGGANWEQLTWPQPDPSQFDVPGALGGSCVMDLAVKLGWRVEKHPRVLAKLTRSGFADIVGFNDCGVWTALGNGDGSFQPPTVVIADFGILAGDWQVDKHPRFVIDLNGDGLADIIGFGDAGVWTAIGNGDGTFQAPVFIIPDFGYDQGWRVDKHVRLLADLTGKGQPSIVGFGDAGVYVALNKDDKSGTFNYHPDPLPVIPDFGYVAGEWRVDKHVRLLADLTGHGQASIVGFGDAGVYVALNNDDGSGTFNYHPDPLPVIPDFGYSAGGWRVDKHVRMLADLTGNGQASIVGFGDAGVYVALNNDDHSGTFNYHPDPLPVIPDFGYNQGWRVDRHPRFLADLTGKGQASIVGFGDAGVYVAPNKDDKSGTFIYHPDPLPATPFFGYVSGDWRVEKHPRLLADLTGKGRASIVAFGDAGVWTAVGDGTGAFPSANFVQTNFGYGTIVLALLAVDRAAGSRGIWRSSDGGSSWSLVHQFPGAVNLGQLEWALGSDHLVYAAGGTSVALSGNAGQTFQDVQPWSPNPQGSLNVNHIAVWQEAPADPFPAVIYALGDGVMFLSIDGGFHWLRDRQVLPDHVGGPTSPGAIANSAKVMAISPRNKLEIFVAQNGSGGPDKLFVADYSQFPFGNRTSSWVSVTLPAALSSTDTADSGNVFVVATKPGRGDLVFYGAQRMNSDGTGSPAYVAPLAPSSGSDWSVLGIVHVDLHGLLLSPDFAASISTGNYHPKAGTVWILSDGGIYRSSDGGQNFDPAETATTLSSLSVAGVAIAGKPPALSLNQGDNDGFYSMNGGENWSFQDYGGGDNDCAFADPLRPNSILLFTPRRNTAGVITPTHATRNGQTVSVYETGAGNLPNASSGTNDRRVMTGPPTATDPKVSGVVWNANSFSGERGFRPIVLTMAGEDPPPQGDYIFILFNPAVVPNPGPPLLVRTQNILDIKSRQEWVTTATGPGQGAKVFLQGPPLPGSSLDLVQASGGHANTVFFVGGDGTLWTWTSGAAAWNQLVPTSASAQIQVINANRFFVSPYQPKLIYVLDNDQVVRSDDGGQTWQVDQSLEQQLTWNGQIQITGQEDPLGIREHFDLVLTDMQFDPFNPLVRFAIGAGGAFMTTDGETWTRLLHTGALPGRPSSCYYDFNSDPLATLYVAFAGRSLVKITGLEVAPIIP